MAYVGSCRTEREQSVDLGITIFLIAWVGYMGWLFPPPPSLDAEQIAKVYLDNAVGINHTYLFLEYYWSELNGIGQTNPLRVGTESWAAGLSFEF